MARMESAMIGLGTAAPPFELLDVRSGRTISRDRIFATSWGPNATGPIKPMPGGGASRSGLLVLFVCPHCPYVKHVELELGRIGQDYFRDGHGPIAIVAIQPNDTEQYPMDGPDGMREQADRCGWTFPYLLDQTQVVARGYGAACTPDLFLFNADLKLVYRGQIDSSRPRRSDNSGNNTPVTGEDLRRAMDAVIAGRPPDLNQRGSLGCSIKWRETSA